MKNRVDAALAEDPWMLPREVVSKLRLPVAPKTVARYRTKNCRKVKGVTRPALSARNKQGRLNLPKNHVNDSFDNVVFTDEKSFFRFKVTRSALDKRGRDLPFRTQPVHPPRVQVLGGITRRGRTALRFFDGQLTGVKRRGNLKAILPSVRRVHRDDSRDLQDNDPVHTGRMSQQLLRTAVPHVLRIPAQSPDFNVIEHVWSALDARVAAHRARTVSDLKTAIEEEWHKLTATECNRIIDSLRQTLLAVIAAGGEHVTPADRRRYRA
eukprot:TRINITY_DN1904_c0_g2_i7.p1 TRINITY_DN1904_c0_g2~~TRINITY_DN1904_c0_g2_i7.p1  ORF type:complete len:267 (-),score=10.73 TRINITY_DN1904_c0_g2_i7:391-1191(-)